jgi:metallo-beta-lactamase family protein
MGEVNITFLGATETVTGSRFLVSSEKRKILVDAGMFQGTKEMRRKNWEPFPIDPSSIDAIVLTHAHLDHCGYLPLLVRNGFSGSIHSTDYTEKLAAVILRDSARLQTEDAKYAAEKGFSKHATPLPLYDINDVENTLKLFKEVTFREKFALAEDIFVTFYPSGHILGSAFVALEMEGRNLLFTGDMGRNNHPLLASPDAPPPTHFEVVVTESTYGDRAHETSTETFADEINDALKRGGSILIPAFAVDRTEVILMALKELIVSKKIPNIPIYVDSPMALTALDYYREAVEKGAVELRVGVVDKWRGTDPFNPGNLTQLRTVEDSKSINKLDISSIIISASGMATGGRVVHHLANMLPDPRNTVILVGFQAAGSRGRSLEEGRSQVKMLGKWIPVQAHIAKVESFSVHADGNELIAWLKQMTRPDQAFVVHGERDTQKIFASRLVSELGWNAIIPQAGRTFPIGSPHQ